MPSATDTAPRRRIRDERGSVAVQMVIILPAVFAVMFLGLQAALYYHAKSLAIAAAQEGAREAGSESGTTASGAQVANDFLRTGGGDDVLSDSSVTAGRTATTATVTVSGTSLSVIPGWHVRVIQTASVPVERLTQ